MIQEQPSSQSGGQHPASFKMEFGLASFEQSIRGNFQLMQHILKQHEEAINQLRGKVGIKTGINCMGKHGGGEKEALNPENNQKEENVTKGQDNKNKDSGQNINATDVNEVGSEKEPENKDKEEVERQNQQKRQTESQQKNQIKMQILPPNEHASLPNNQLKVDKQQQPIKDSNVQIDVEVSNISKAPPLLPIQETEYIRPSGFSQMEQKAIQTKMFELFQRVRQLQEKSLFDARQNQKEFKQLEFSIEANQKSILKTVKAKKDYEEEISKLRNELSEYKLKKETKLNKLIHSSSVNQSSIGGNENYDYLAQKIQFLLKHIREVLTKSQFEEERDELTNSIDVLRKKLKESVNEKYLGQSMKNMEVKILTIVSKYLKANSMKNGKKEGDGSIEQEQDELNQIIDEGNKQFNQKVSLHEQKIQDLSEQISQMKSEIDMMRKQRLKSELDISQQFKQISHNERELQLKISDLEHLHQDFKQNINQKHLDSQNQIIDLQEQVQKINSHIKTYSYAQNEVKSGVLPKPKREEGEVPNNSTQDLPSGNTLSIEQDIILLKKKVGKVNLKMQTVKEDFLTMRQEITREIDNLKMGMERKADWDGLKKGLDYFQQRLKQTKLVIEHLYNSQSKPEGDNSLAVKKGWTCLMCDRDINNYEGKLSQLKFTSVFPVREAPRIGGYYKQQQSSQQYKQIFMNPKNNRRVSSIRSHQSSYSKQDLNN